MSEGKEVYPEPEYPTHDPFVDKGSKGWGEGWGNLDFDLLPSDVSKILGSKMHGLADTMLTKDKGPLTAPTGFEKRGLAKEGEGYALLSRALVELQQSKRP